MKVKATALILASTIALFLASCSPQANLPSELLAAPGSSAANGRRLIASYGCGSCHAIPGIPGADATVGPPLEQFYRRHYIAGQLTNTSQNLAQWIQNPQQIKPGTGMPNLGVSEDEARDMAAYLERQPTFGDWLGQ